ncbi:MAG: GHMP kinase [Candidatus Liptonbacteria bacterium]|nr:GHMP kinase [Candidatus Liptonbacteria bacterium]
MIVVRAPLRISFVGGGTDLPDFYHRYPGRVISTAIDKYVHLVFNRTPLVPKISVRYNASETVDHPKDLVHTRVRAALLDMGIHKGLEIGSFGTLPAKTGLGSSSSFSVALMKGLNAYMGKKLDKYEAAEAASRLEIQLVGEPIGKQDQYAASFGGLNIFQFNPNDSVEVTPVLLDFKKRMDLENHTMLFFTGLTRAASSVLTEQRKNINDKFETLKQMSDSVPKFATLLAAGDFKGCGEMLHEGWVRKKSLASNVSNPVIDDLYGAGMTNGAWGGKVLGAGGGGCVMFLAPLDKKPAIRAAVQKIAVSNSLKEFQEIPVKFIQSGAEILFNGDHGQKTTLA